jgi:SAM-dependent methyltransferase
MEVNEMRMADPVVEHIANEGELLGAWLPLQGATVLELGCGKAEKTRLVAQQAAAVLALEVDEIQLTKNLALNDLPNVRFAHGAAENIPAEAACCDIVLMFKSLHHVPVALMDEAFAEIHRVLRPGGLAYISEPVYAGDFNEILRLFHDEKLVREAAFAAVQRAVASGKFVLQRQQFFLQPMHFENFEQFAAQVIGVTHTEHRLSPELLAQVRARFERHIGGDGAHFLMPIRVDLLAKHP